ncbi:uncharacterized protein [Euwallacea fornicatus]|uniref:uncharacterized protein n=1 Tax=Euwallacea fornicatus TaxID=995702 RepID=UPI00338F5B3C
MSNKIKKKDEKNSKTQCTHCHYIFANVPNLIRHMKKKHNAPKVYGVKENYLYNCECGKNFNVERLFKFHLKKVHQIDISKTSGQTKKCAFCDYTASRKEDLLSHYQSTHEINIPLEELTFNNICDFCDWKSNIQDAAFSTEYTKHIGKCRHIAYVCNRSGYYNPSKKDGERKRRLKHQGSHKINAYCPASIKVKVEQDGKCLVEYINLHVGHGNEIEHLTLNPKERNELAVKIASGIPFETILNDIRNSVDDYPKRICRTTKKDLQNIKLSFKLDSISSQNSEKFLNLKDWVIAERDSGSILVYKPIGETNLEYPELLEEDFALILMNQPQSEILNSFSSECVCVDRTHNLNNSQLELVTVMVIDGKNQGFPCAFLATNKIEKRIVSLLFSELKKWAGVNLTKIFMSDVDPVFYDSWMEMVKPAEKQVFSPWHVDKSWRENLEKIELPERRVEIYKRLRLLVDEQSDFTEALARFCEDIENDPDTLQFASYFRDQFANTPQSWANSYTDSDNNEPLERMHRVIKYIYLHEKNIDNYELALYDIMKFIKDTMFIKLNMLNKMNITTKVNMVKMEHTLSLPLDVKLINKDDWWEILPPVGDIENTTESYKITEVSQMCHCRLKCPFCNVCIHKYSCSCTNSVIQWNMCKHVHFLCRYMVDVEKESDASIEEREEYKKLDEDHNVDAGTSVETIPTFDCDLITESGSIPKRRKIEKHIQEPFEEGLQQIAETSLAKEKERLRLKLMKHFESIETLEDLNLLKNCLASLSKKSTF